MKKINTLLVNGMDFKSNKQKPSGDLCRINGQAFYKISNVENMRPFFMSIVSSSDHWLFLSSNGGISAGRANSNNSLFPYTTDDKVTDNAENTGSKSIFKIFKAKKKFLWEPFSDKYEGIYATERNLYKNLYGNKVIFEEINKDLGLSFRYEWTTSDEYGFIRNATFSNLSGSKIQVEFVDGLQNVLPWGIDESLQNTSSNLVDAYKRAELEHDSKMGIYALSAIIVDKAEPSEALKSNVVWSTDFLKAKRLLSSEQIKLFRSGLMVKDETDIKGARNSYFINSSFSLSGRGTKDWTIIADLGKDASGVVHLTDQIKKNKKLKLNVFKSIDQGTINLLKLVGSADGIQLTNDTNRNARHFANTLFNIMRGGVFDNNYQIRRDDFLKYLRIANKNIAKKYAGEIEALPKTFNPSRLKRIPSSDPDFFRLVHEYLPLKFSRRHGDPSRPWNKFDIRMKDPETGDEILDYQGNWRDIFQNWEALASSFPNFIEAMIFKFLNASTFDGYNPYRLTRDGFDWETIEPDNPWAYIGYWGDHQIIYLLKLLEFSCDYHPENLKNYLNEQVFVCANVPYKIKGQPHIFKDPKNTIEYDFAEEEKVLNAKKRIGSDGGLLRTEKKKVLRVTLVEKLLITLLTKASNLIPEAGIWMNTQRPEWNDANNALVGNGVSMVTLFYLRRFTSYLDNLLEQSKVESFKVSVEVDIYFKQLSQLLAETKAKSSDKARYQTAKQLTKIASKYRQNIYKNMHSGDFSLIGKNEIVSFLKILNKHLDRAIQSNKTSSSLYHSYNLIDIINEEKISISHLPVMLEGQVAALSSNETSCDEALEILEALSSSNLYRKDQSSFMLYPAKKLPGFLEKNIIPKTLFVKSKLLQRLVKDKNKSIVLRDKNGKLHFHPSFNNADALSKALCKLPNKYEKQVANERSKIHKIYEDVFNHKAFTGRSGTFYGYEGLGSIYWHMVSKLLLATQEVIKRGIENKAPKRTLNRLIKKYYEINEGIGADKSPLNYGAFPTDPYSHTPTGKGAQQPGMTGQVKEDYIARMTELGVNVSDGEIYFDSTMLKVHELLRKKTIFDYVNVKGNQERLELRKNTLAFTLCQVPVVYQKSKKPFIDVIFANQNKERITGLKMPSQISKKLFDRDGTIEKIIVSL